MRLILATVIDVLLFLLDQEILRMKADMPASIMQLSKANFLLGRLQYDREHLKDVR